MVLSEGKMSLKNPVTPPGIDPGTVRLVAQRLNHYAALGPFPVAVVPNDFFYDDEKTVQSPKSYVFFRHVQCDFSYFVVLFIADTILKVVVDWGDVFPNLEVPGSSLGLNEMFNGFPESLYASTKFLSD
jgi:hypothetical protein